MSAAAVTVRYDGPILKDHRMDVADLAPALLGLSELCKIANQKFNGDKAAVKVLIGTDVEHQCFQVDLHVVQTVWDSTKRILTNDDIASAKDFLEWLGLVGTIGGTACGAVVGFFRLLKLINGKKITSTKVEVKEGRDVVRVTIDGDHNTVILVHPQALALLHDEKAVASAKKVVQPLTQDGYETLEFETNDEVFEKISRDEAAAISAISAASVEESDMDVPQTLNVWISVYSPVYDARAKFWRFKFGGAHEYMDISETNIAEVALKRGCAMIDDAYRVELEVTQEHKAGGSITNHYKIKKVLDFKPARLPYQTDAFRDPGNPENSN